MNQKKCINSSKNSLVLREKNKKYLERVYVHARAVQIIHKS